MPPDDYLYSYVCLLCRYVLSDELNVKVKFPTGTGQRVENEIRMCLLLYIRENKIVIVQCDEKNPETTNQFPGSLVL